MNAVLKKTSLENTTALALPPFPKPAISIVGLGYVGAVSAACLSKTGHQVIGVDIDEMKVGQIANGESPIHEADLEEYLQDGVANGLVSATVDLEQAVIDTDVTFVSVGTPTAADGGCDHTYIVEAARAIGRGLAIKGTYHVVVMRCSIPPGSTLNVMVPEIEAASGLKMGEDFGVCFNPEFLREGTAIADFFAPPKTVIGANDEKAAQIVEDIYRGLEGELLKTTIDVAEMVKYVDNVWHATKVCFANEIGRICKPLAIDSHKVMDIFVKDTKLNLSPYYLKPGFAYGGSCLPKEVRAVSHLADKLNVRAPLVRSLAATNMLQIENAADLVRKSGCRKIGFMGLAFKAGTDDLRESPILEVINALAQEEYDVLAYDPAIKADTRIGAQFNYVANACPHLRPLVEALPQMLCEDPQKVIAECDAIVVTQNTPAIRQLVSSALGRVEIIDLIRIFNEVPTWKGYHGIGW